MAFNALLRTNDIIVSPNMLSPSWRLLGTVRFLNNLLSCKMDQRIDWGVCVSAQEQI